MTDQPTTSTRPSRPGGLPAKALLITTVVLGLIAVAYLWRGFHYLANTERAPTDLSWRWTEQQWILQGHTAEAQRQHLAGRPPADDVPHLDTLIAHARSRSDGSLNDEQLVAATSRKVRLPSLGGYPPWSFVLGTGLYWPSRWESARTWFALVNLVGLLVIGTWGFRSMSRHGVMPAVWLVAAVFAINAFCNTLVIGQYGIVIVAALVGCLWCTERGHNIGAGLWLGIAMAKPTLAAPFVLPFLVRRQFRPLVVAAAYVVAASLGVWFYTGVDPIEMFLAPLKNAHHSASHGDGALSHLVGWGVAPRAAMIGLAVSVSLAGTFLLVRARSASPLVLFALAGVLARLWTYHQRYDNLILVFLLVCLAQLAWSRSDRRITVALVLLGASLWIPARIGDLATIQLLQIVLWAGLPILLVACHRQAAHVAEHVPLDTSEAVRLPTTS